MIRYNSAVSFNNTISYDVISYDVIGIRNVNLVTVSSHVSRLAHSRLSECTRVSISIVFLSGLLSG